MVADTMIASVFRASQLKMTFFPASFAPQLASLPSPRELIRLSPPPAAAVRPFCIPILIFDYGFILLVNS
jgi:hypothetical protein